MNNRHNQDEYSLRRSINNTLRNKSNLLKNGGSSSQKSTLKKFAPNIDNLKNENKIKTEQVDKLDDSLNDKSIQELIKKTINFDLQNEQKKNDNNFSGNKINKAFPPHGAKKNLSSNNLNLLNLEYLQAKKDGDDNGVMESLQKKKTSIDIYELNNISKNIFYNKKTTSSDAHFLPLTLPFFTNNEKQKKIRKLFLNKEPFFFSMQLPNMLPALLRNEEQNENKDDITNKRDRQPAGCKTEEKEQMEKKKEKKLIQKTNNSAYELSNVSTLPNGKFAKLIIYKNKKIKMKINDILFDVDEGSECTFSQEIACYIKENSEFIFLGNCDNKLVATPNIERIINKK
ncbi:DNA-directed RNA polymerase III subunit RPC4, putative [Plasmodium knowlesi strain H]|uniref:DNA-directed RNA polymerase III subunit RPC4, putative n=3 Tax=Plasmodium knowlesi TaxID=5850 RepID=A0A5K1VFA7_PLAKH|nr:DNA-directed RNA polymerase III subunit RPC4, putative [Plasmodium knowlesi strain H]OTN65317.1 putative DNA-directed RNA polymerase III subunit RPC4 [Plasmodium knowlesi]CAA9989507.1 DNA-directed RNA polymerase III subunit RPC4, putative [Plasmodium knowlesi strain H]SBO25191.1 DNA-directed RNA polymerase III subunit RPC4, putative [Plasmodium knowlesi strain H]SBO27765.1 DNA-directed RNA polymerase III subunit RPC4, putative [Plasmodium knowlesi strain H]VVS78981.1 DNA-directed RNA polyme|eukprot:XP_002260232.1 hypothetical protein, conserved in Plasmodium species [Plasmodium knowlesi strain H]